MKRTKDVTLLVVMGPILILAVLIQMAAKRLRLM